jgi:transposase-like protein
MLAKKASRRRYSRAEKQRILSIAAKEGLTGAQVQRKFGIAQLTFYRWRGPVRGPKARAARAAGAGAVMGAGGTESIRAEVRRGVQAVLPQVIREEVANYLAQILGNAPRRRGRPPGSKNKRPGRPRKRK